MRVIPTAWFSVIHCPSQYIVRFFAVQDYRCSFLGMMLKFDFMYVFSDRAIFCRKRKNKYYRETYILYICVTTKYKNVKLVGLTYN